MTTKVDKKNYFWDENHTRYHLSQSNEGPAYNWLFFPGGPGADSRYLLSLTDHLTLPGNTWLIDFPGNGDNEVVGKPDYDFDHWFDLFIPTIEKFSNPIYVGQSFGGMLPLLFPQLENLLKGLVILNSSPSLWAEESARMAAEKGKPSLENPMGAFLSAPNEETFKQVLLACLPYYFSSEENMKIGCEILNIPFNFRAARWGIQKLAAINYNAAWIPERVLTLILGGSEDCMTPPCIFENDVRFKRKNIIMHTIENAGHCPWIENMSEVKICFDQFLTKLRSMP